MAKALYNHKKKGSEPILSAHSKSRKETILYAVSGDVELIEYLRAQGLHISRITVTCCPNVPRTCSGNATKAVQPRTKDVRR